VTHLERLYSAGQPRAGAPADADPITTEVIRHSLNSAAEQMKQALIRTAFSPVVYEILDFAAALYDRQARLLAQAPSNPLFMGTLDFCIRGAIEAVGGEERWQPGDIVLLNIPYLTGSHQQDAGVIMPCFAGQELVGYAVIKAHWLDMGAKEPYCTDTVDVYQEGVIFPGVKLYEAGKRVEAVYRMALANSRIPGTVAGDINAEIVGVRTGVQALEGIVRRFGNDTFWPCVERMYDHGEEVMRASLAALPDGVYRATGQMDNDGVDPGPVDFEVRVQIEGSDVTIDYTGTPEQRRGPINCPVPSTLAASRVAIAMLAGPNEPPNEGHFRPIRVRTRSGSIFDPVSPAPCFLYGWLALQAIDVIHHALADTMSEAVPAGSGGCICGLVWWGGGANGREPWSDSTAHPIGQGAHAHGDGGPLIHLGEAASRFASAEVYEARYPLLWEQMELAPDSCGAGQHRGGLGVDSLVTALEDAWVTCVVERTKNRPWGLQGGQPARPNSTVLRQADGRVQRCDKATGVHVPPGARLEVRSGGGGGFGPSDQRPRELVEADLRAGYISERYARKHYPHVFAQQGLETGAPR
jgi:N-methylhydantoinase B